MVTAKESRTCQQLAAWNLHHVDNIPLLQPEQKYSLPPFPPSAFTANMTFPVQSASDLQGLNPRGVEKLLPPHCNILCPTGESALASGLGFANKPNDVSFAPQKRFIIFDQSGNHTRLFFSPSLSHQNQIISSKIPTSYGNLGARVDHVSLVKPVVEEKWDENHLSDEEGDILDDTEEIDALLYSDSDYTDNDNADDDNVEITNNEAYNSPEDTNILEVLDEEVASSDGSRKRRKLLGGNYEKPSRMSAESLLKEDNPSGYEDDVESSYAGAGISCKGIDSSKRGSRVKIREALKMLETIIPGSKTQDPFSTIDKAIIYLKSLKTEAEALKLRDPPGIEDKWENTNVENE